jgi:pre-mRNA-splicing factor CDC5/CEF1
LPAPKNDYEIVVPAEDEIDETYKDPEPDSKVEDQADVEKRRNEEIQERRREEFKKLCQAVQRDFPRPRDVNMTILRPSGMDQLTELQKV